MGQVDFLNNEEKQQPEDFKVCTKCDLKLPVDMFSKRERGAYRRTECKSCMKALQDERDEVRKTVDDPPDDHSCPICLKTKENVVGGNKTSSPWVLDHCHKSKKFRGWLCHKCNRSLGGFDDDTEMLKRAIKYLEDTKQ
jgi:hypothetical protein